MDSYDRLSGVVIKLRTCEKATESHAVSIHVGMHMFWNKKSLRPSDDFKIWVATAGNWDSHSCSQQRIFKPCTALGMHGFSTCKFIVIFRSFTVYLNTLATITWLSPLISFSIMCCLEYKELLHLHWDVCLLPQCCGCYLWCS